LWDVDGNGLSKINDDAVAQAILQKVNAMNFENAVKVFVPVTTFALLPQSVASTLVFFALVFAILYALQGRIPDVTD